MVENQLYFIAIVPPEPLQSLLWEFKQEVARKFSSVAALRSPPHVTLHMPFKLSEKRKETLYQGLHQLAGKRHSFRMELDGFGAFEPKVIYINVSKDQPLESLQKGIKDFMMRKMSIHNANYKKRPFKPHLTIAFRDLKKSQFPKAWEYYRHRPFKSACEIDAFSLLTHDGKKWNLEYEFKFQKQ